MNCIILTHTHSDYSYLWPIINDFSKNNNIKKVLAYNKIPANTNLPECFNKYIQYDDNVLFTTRLIPILEQLEEEFVFLIYDVDIIININETALENYISIMKENHIDRVNIAVFDGTETLHKNEFSLCNLNKPLKQKSNHFTPTDCNSTIWNKRSFLNFLNIFPNEKYNSFDLNQDIINYCKSKIKCYGIQYTPNLKILYNRGLTYCNYLSFLHITTGGKFLYPLTCYADYEEILKQIINDYKLDIKKIGIQQAHGGCFNCMKLKL